MEKLVSVFYTWTNRLREVKKLRSYGWQMGWYLNSGLSDSRAHALHFTILPPTSPLSDIISVEISGLDGLFPTGVGGLGPKLT